MINIIAILLLGTRALVGTHSGVSNLDFSDNFVSENSAQTETTMQVRYTMVEFIETTGKQRVSLEF